MRLFLHLWRCWLVVGCIRSGNRLQLVVVQATTTSKLRSSNTGDIGVVNPEDVPENTVPTMAPTTPTTQSPSFVQQRMTSFPTWSPSTVAPTISPTTTLHVQGHQENDDNNDKQEDEPNRQSPAKTNQAYKDDEDDEELSTQSPSIASPDKDLTSRFRPHYRRRRRR